MRPFFALDGEQEDAGESGRIAYMYIYMYLYKYNIFMHLHVHNMQCTYLLSFLLFATCIQVDVSKDRLRNVHTLHVDLLLFIVVLFLFIVVLVKGVTESLRLLKEADTLYPDSAFFLFFKGKVHYLKVKELS